MSILDSAKIGDLVQVSLELSKDRLAKEIIDAINDSSVAKINDFKITDGKGIGVVLQLSNGKEQWFFEDEIDLLDEYGNVIKKINYTKENNFLFFDTLKVLKYENKNRVKDLLKMTELSSKYDLVIGSRYIDGGAIEGWGLIRKYLSKISNLFAKFLLKTTISDLTTGFRIYSLNSIRSIDFQKIDSNGYSFLVELLNKIIKGNFKIIECLIWEHEFFIFLRY